MRARSSTQARQTMRNGIDLAGARRGYSLLLQVLHGGPGRAAGQRGTAEIFINYRREDTQQAAGRLHLELCRHFGKERVFMDTRTIAPGAPFPEVIASELGRCRVFLPLLGKDWLRILDERSNDAAAADYVRREIADALQGGLHIIPLPIDGACVPAAGALPEEIRGFVARHAHALRHSTWDADCAGLLAAIDQHLAALPGSDTDAAWNDARARARHGMGRQLDHPVFTRFAEVCGDWPRPGLPQRLEHALAAPPATLGRQTCEALYLCVRQMGEALRDSEVVVSRREGETAQKRLRAAMGCAARLCLDPLVLRRLRPLGRTASRGRLPAPASEIAGATLPHREEPDKTWTTPQNEGRAPLEDRAAIPVTIETGDDASPRDKLARLMHRHVFPQLDVPALLDEQTCARLRAENVIAALKGEARFFVFAASDESALSDALTQWIVDHLATDVLVLQDRAAGEGLDGLYRYDETTLLTLVAHLLRELAAPEWNPP